MATKKTAKMVKRVRVKASLSFDGFVIGEEIETELTDRVAGLISGGNFKVVWHGESEAGPAAADAGDSGGGPEGAAEEGPAGAEESADPGAGGHGAPAE